MASMTVRRSASVKWSVRALATDVDAAAPRGREGDELASAVGGVGAAFDEAALLEDRERRCHRLRPHLLAGGEGAGGRVAVAEQPAQHGGLGGGEAIEPGDATAPTEA